MRATIFFLSVCIVSMSFWSCSSIRSYRAGTTGSVKSYTAIPEYYGEKKVKTYASVNYSTGSIEQTNFDSDRKFILSLNSHRAHSDKYYGFYYGGGVSYGQYKFNSKIPSVIETGESKSFFSLDTKVGGMLQKAWNSIDWRILGAEFTYNYEFGSYQDQLEDLEGEFSSIKVYNNPSILAYNVSSELVYKVNPNNAFGLGLFYGAVIDSNERVEDKADFGGLTMHYKYSDYTFSIVHNSTANSEISTVKLGLTYNFL